MAADSMAAAGAANFLGNAPTWYKASVVGFLLANALLAATAGGALVGWVLLAQFVFCLWHARRCYPLQPAGLLALEAAALGLTGTDAIYTATLENLPVVLLVVFLMAAAYFLREILCAALVRVLLAHRSKSLLAAGTMFAAALLSALIDALSLAALALTASGAVYAVYHQAASGGPPDEGQTDDDEDPPHSELARFRAFLRSLAMHGAIGAAIGGAASATGEAANIVLGSAAGLPAVAFSLQLAAVSLPALGAALLTCWLLERYGRFGFGTPLPDGVRAVLSDWQAGQRRSRDGAARAVLTVQACGGALLLAGLVLRVTEVGVVAVGVLIVQTALNGVTEEKRLGHAFEAGLPFTALLVVLFAILAVVREQALFEPAFEAALAMAGALRELAVFALGGALAAFSDGVFVASEALESLLAARATGALTGGEFERLIVALAAGVNLPSVLAPGGHVAFLLLVTSSFARLARLSYPRMVWMALPFAFVLSVVPAVALLVGR